MNKGPISQGLAVLQRRQVGVLEYACTIELPDGDFAGTRYDPIRVLAL